jgi:PKD repeat protein
VLSPQNIRRILLALTSIATLLAGGDVAVAHAAYGELGSPIVETGNVETGNLKPHVFGIEPGGGNFFVGDEVTRTENSKEERFYRIQKFGSSGTALAESTKIKVSLESEALGPAALEGIAVDTAGKRLYVLVVREREAEEEAPIFDATISEAANLYEYSTEVKNSNKELELIKNIPLLPKAETARALLLEPHGITIDPKTGEVVILGQEDEQTTPGESPEMRAAVQFVAPNGNLGARYVDLENCLDEGAGGETACTESSGQPFSPVISPEGKVLVERSGEIWELPPTKEVSSGRFETHPRRVLPSEPQREELGPEQKVLQFPQASEEQPGVGGTMSLVPEGGAGVGKIYLTTGITPTPSVKGAVTNPGVLVLDYAEPGGVAETKELGWVGGGAEGVGQCSIPKFGSRVLPVVGGEHEDVYLFDFHAHIEPHPAGVELFKFGPGGTGCPSASATEPSVKVKNSLGKEVEVSKVPLGEAATLSSEVTGGNATSVAWKFEHAGKEEAKDAAEELEAASYQFGTTSLKHKFEQAGEYEITEVIATDDLASPALEVKRKIVVETTPLAVEFNYPASVVAGKAAKLEATVIDPHEPGAPHLKYTWEFGGGEEKSGETTATSFSEEHIYPAEGEESVTLKVTDGHGVVGEATHVISVSKAEAHGGEGPKGEGPKSETSKTEAPKTEAPKVEAAPEATLASSSLSVTASGAVKLEIGCPAGDSSCSGTVTLRTLGAVGARASGRRKGKHKAILTLATGSFTVAGGQTQAVALHLSSAGRALLARLHTLRVQATIVAHDPSGTTHTTQTTITLRVAAKSKHRHKH